MESKKGKKRPKNLFLEKISKIDKILTVSDPEKNLKH